LKRVLGSFYAAVVDGVVVPGSFTKD